MRQKAFAVALLLLSAVLAVSQSSSDADSQSHKETNQVTITGCLLKSPHNHYEIVDEKGITNLVYSSKVKLGAYVGKSVTLTGERSAMPSTDTGTSRPMPHFVVKDVQPASGSCK